MTLPVALLQNRCFILCLLVVSGWSVASPPSLPPSIHSDIITTIEHVFKEDFPQAETQAKRLIRKEPDHPAGYFCMAYVLDSWMALFQSDEKENEFYRYCDQAIDKGEKYLVKNKDDAWARFFIGGADGYKGTYEARYERWITAFRFGWKGVSVLLDLKKEGVGIPDIYSGIGCYHYWRSAMMKSLWWMPGIEDKREESIVQLKKVRREGIYTRLATSVNLIDILLNEELFDEALKVADAELRTYPRSTVFLWGKARSLFGLQRYNEAVTLLQQLITKVEQMPPDNHFNTTYYHLYRAKCYMALKQYDEAAKSCTSIERFTYEPDIKKRLNSILGEVKSIHKAARQQLR